MPQIITQKRWDTDVHGLTPTSARIHRHLYVNIYQHLFIYMESVRVYAPCAYQQSARAYTTIHCIALQGIMVSLHKETTQANQVIHTLLMSIITQSAQQYMSKLNHQNRARPMIFIS